MTRARALSVPSLVLALGLLSPGSAARAEGDLRIQLVAPASTPAGVRSAVRRLLARNGEVVTEAPARGGASLDLVVTARFRAWGRSRQLSMVYEDGRTGTTLLRVTHRLRGARLDAAAEHGILRETRMAAAVATPRRGASRRGGGGASQREARAEARAEEAREREAREEEARDREEARARAAAEARAAEEAERAQTRRRDEDDGGSGRAREGGGLPPPIAWDAEHAAPRRARARRAPRRAPRDADEEEEAEEADDEDPEGDEEAAEDNDDEGPGLLDDLRFRATGAAGFGLRSSEVPVEGGMARLTTSPFPALGVDVEVTAPLLGDGVFEGGLALRYLTSVGLRGRDDGPIAEGEVVSMRAQQVAIEARGRLALSSAERPLSLTFAAGWRLRMLSTELPTTAPDHTLSGFFFSAGVYAPLGDGPLALELSPEVGAVLSRTETAPEQGATPTTPALGGRVAVHLVLSEDLSLAFAYRESHVLPTATSGVDIERWGTLQATYRR